MGLFNAWSLLSERVMADVWRTCPHCQSLVPIDGWHACPPPFPTPPATGWRCPSCRTVWGPLVTRCKVCSKSEINL